MACCLVRHPQHKGICCRADPAVHTMHVHAHVVVMIYLERQGGDHTGLSAGEQLHPGATAGVTLRLDGHKSAVLKGLNIQVSDPRLLSHCQPLYERQHSMRAAAMQGLPA